MSNARPYNTGRHSDDHRRTSDRSLPYSHDRNTNRDLFPERARNMRETYQAEPHNSRDTRERSPSDWRAFRNSSDRHEQRSDAALYRSGSEIPPRNQSPRPLHTRQGSFHSNSSVSSRRRSPSPPYPQNRAPLPRSDNSHSNYGDIFKGRDQRSTPLRSRSPELSRRHWDSSRTYSREYYGSVRPTEQQLRSSVDGERRAAPQIDRPGHRSFIPPATQVSRLSGRSASYDDRSRDRSSSLHDDKQIIVSDSLRQGDIARRVSAPVYSGSNEESSSLSVKRSESLVIEGPLIDQPRLTPTGQRLPHSSATQLDRISARNSYATTLSTTSGTHEQTRAKSNVNAGGKTSPNVDEALQASAGTSVMSPKDRPSTGTSDNYVNPFDLMDNESSAEGSPGASGSSLIDAIPAMAKSPQESVVDTSYSLIGGIQDDGSTLAALHDHENGSLDQRAPTEASFDRYEEPLQVSVGELQRTRAESVTSEASTVQLSDAGIQHVLHGDQIEHDTWTDDSLLPMSLHQDEIRTMDDGETFERSEAEPHAIDCAVSRPDEIQLDTASIKSDMDSLRSSSPPRSNSMSSRTKALIESDVVADSITSSQLDASKQNMTDRSSISGEQLNNLAINGRHVLVVDEAPQEKVIGDDNNNYEDDDSSDAESGEVLEDDHHPKTEAVAADAKVSGENLTITNSANTEHFLSSAKSPVVSESVSPLITLSPWKTALIHEPRSREDTVASIAPSLGPNINEAERNVDNATMNEATQDRDLTQFRETSSGIATAQSLNRHHTNAQKVEHEDVSIEDSGSPVNTAMTWQSELDGDVATAPALQTLQTRETQASIGLSLESAMEDGNEIASAQDSKQDSPRLNDLETSSSDTVAMPLSDLPHEVQNEDQNAKVRDEEDEIADELRANTEQDRIFAESNELILAFKDGESYLPLRDLILSKAATDDKYSTGSRSVEFQKEISRDYENAAKHSVDVDKRKTYREPCEYKFYQSNIEAFERDRSKIVALLLEQKLDALQEDEELRDEYEKRQKRWQQHSARCDRQRLLELQQEESEAALAASMLAPSRGTRNKPVGFEITEAMIGLETPNNVLNEAVIPKLLRNTYDREVYNYQDINDLVDHPLEFYHISVPDSREIWTDDEQAIFSARYKMTPKQFGVIAAGLPGRSPQDCVLHYYKTKKFLDYRASGRQKVVKAGSRGRGRAKKVVVGRTTRRQLLATVSAMDADADEEEVEEESEPKGLRKRRAINDIEESTRRPKTLRKTISKKSGQESVATPAAMEQATASLAQPMMNLPRSNLPLQFSSTPPLPAPMLQGRNPILPQAKHIQELQHPFAQQAVSNGLNFMHNAAKASWTDSDEVLFVDLLRRFGTDYSMIASHMHTKTVDQIQKHFDEYLIERGYRQLLPRNSGPAMRPPLGHDYNHAPNAPLVSSSEQYNNSRAPLLNPPQYQSQYSQYSQPILRPQQQYSSYSRQDSIPQQVQNQSSHNPYASNSHATPGGSYNPQSFPFDYRAPPPPTSRNGYESRYDSSSRIPDRTTPAPSRGSIDSMLNSGERVHLPPIGGPRTAPDNRYNSYYNSQQPSYASTPFNSQQDNRPNNYPPLNKQNHGPYGGNNSNHAGNNLPGGNSHYSRGQQWR